LRIVGAIAPSSEADAPPQVAEMSGDSIVGSHSKFLLSRLSRVYSTPVYAFVDWLAHGFDF